MEKASKADFKEAMRRAKIKEEVEQEMNESIIGDSAAAYFATDSQVDIDEPRKPGRPKKTKVQPVVPKKRGRKPKTEPKTKDAPKEPVAAGQEEATKQEFSEKDAIKMLASTMDGQINTSYEWAETVRMSIKALKQESCEINRKDALKGLVEIADRWINGRKVDADRYKKISEDIDAQVKQYQGYIDTVKEMIQ